MDSERLSEMDESQLSNPPASDTESSDSDDGAETRPVEWLATTRARRSTAGNRMKSMLANEEPDSDLELLFAEDDNDQGFSDADEAASDVQMDLSSDDDDGDDDNGDEQDTAGANDLSGEKELERQAREKQAAQRKRRAQDAIPAKFRKKKKVRIDARASEASTPAPGLGLGTGAAPRPRKKSERTSWLPLPADQPTRASSRETTRMSKEQLHQQMVEREEKRLRQLAQMQNKAARMAALKKPPMTQEDRLREAAVVEKRNSKSLNRWEVAERQREEERREKLAALHRRTLRGPVITFWSGIGEARRCVVEEEERPKRRREKAKAREEGGPAAAAHLASTTSTDKGNGEEEQQQQTAEDPHSRPEDRPRLMAMPPQAPPCVGDGDSIKPSGVLAAPVLEPPSMMAAPRESPTSNVLAPPNTAQPPPVPACPADTTTARFVPPDDATPAQTEPAKAAESSRNAIVLRNFDADAIRDRSIQVQILLGRKMNRLSKPPPAAICAITNLPAKYRDPRTGLPFHNAHAYRELQRLGRGEHRWSRVLNAWVGSGSVAARGVPERFLDAGAGGGTDRDRDEHADEQGGEAEGGRAGQSAPPQVS